MQLTRQRHKVNMEYTVFYSWQSDTPAETNHAFIRSALDKAVAGIATVNEAPGVEAGIEGIAGTPEVARVVLERVDEAAIFVGDVTFVGEIKRHDGVPKYTPNPNVQLELGYAGSALGWGRVICVMNEHFGKADRLPFDIRHRRFPVSYLLSPTSPSDRTAQLEILTEGLRAELVAVRDSDYRAAITALSRLDSGCRASIGQYRAAERIPEPDPRSFSLGSQSGLDTPRRLSAIGRLLDLGAIRAVQNISSDTYSYAWTYLGSRIAAKVDA
ncbi:MAG: hypothetical protein ABI625_07905 [bacterium]